MRRAYERDGLSETDVDRDPMVQFRRWFDDARQPDLPDWVEVNAMTLSTADAAGRVTSRVILLKGIDGGRFSFFTNYRSEKGMQISSNPQVSLNFFWPHLERQVRVDGLAAFSSPAQSDDYFRSRPRGSRLGAHVSQQSSELPGREVLDKRIAELEAEYAEREIPRPEHWGGYEVTPTRFEFWQGRPSRLHDRIGYLPEGAQWRRVRLSP
jgi:pyridoxamine 5'-phosphate oxidase